MAAAELFDQLRRAPDVEAPDLVAVDATDRLLLDEAADLLVTCRPGEVAVIDDNYGALTLGAAALHRAADVRVHQDLLVGELALARNAERTGLAGCYRQLPLGAELVDGARVVLVQAPKGLEALREIAEVVAASAAPDVTLLVGGRVKHMTHAMNDVLGASFTDVSATLARQKSRVLVARGPRPGTSSFPRRQEHADLGLTVCAHGAAFAGTKIDIGTRALLGSLDRMAPSAGTALDLGCGTGVLAAVLARSRPDLAVLAVDQSAAAVALGDGDGGRERAGGPDPRDPRRRRRARSPTAASTSSSAIRPSTSARRSSRRRPTGSSPPPAGSCAPAGSSGPSTTPRCATSRRSPGWSDPRTSSTGRRSSP